MNNDIEVTRRGTSTLFRKRKAHTKRHGRRPLLESDTTMEVQRWVDNLMIEVNIIEHYEKSVDHKRVVLNLNPQQADELVAAIERNKGTQS